MRTQMQKLAIDTSLRWLTKLAGSELADRLGLREPANRLLYQVTKVSFGALERVVRLKPGSILPNALRAERRGGPATGLFDLTPTETQAMTQKTLRRFAEKVMRPEARAADDAGRPPASALKQARELGLLPMLLPEGLGGAGEPYSPISNALIAEALSWGDMALAVALLAPLSVAQALIDWGNARQQATYLAPFADNGELAAALALVEPQPLFDPWSLRSTARRDRRGFRLRGEKTLVPLGASASYFLIAAHLE
ncbi:MAG: acyl-CoA dehydrogenase family protein, partial [Myxococcales bacterium]|nr:acyl-CoA dehydrogenase family protein [Myxococcales bacterium]